MADPEQANSTIVDTHCHLDQPQFDQDRDEVLARAAEAGVGLIMNPGTDLDSCRRVLGLAVRYPQVYAAVGVHPNDCAGFDDATLAEVRRLAAHPKVVAIGEIGLDYYWEEVPHEQQKRALRAQLALAGELGLPVVLHSRGVAEPGRDSNAELLCELAQWRQELPTPGGPDATIVGVWHAFSGDLADAQTAYGLGFVLSLGGPVTFSNARVLRGLLPELDPGRLMLETDAPYLAPHPYRGKRNEPAYLPLIVEALAAAWQMAPDAVIAQTTATAKRCFTRIR